ncbi:HAMP domain-containing protein, partial [bacterium]|nr:HAMP domain-containing protein [candidate division CSSED10-310 bacterium]
PYCTAIAVYDPSSGWLVWDGSFTAPPTEWLDQARANSTEESVFIQDQPARCGLVSMTAQNNRVYCIFCDIAVNSHLTQQAGMTLSDVLRHQIQETAFTQPLDPVLPDPPYLENGVRNPLFENVLIASSQRMDTHGSQMETSHSPCCWTLARNPQFYAGETLLTRTASSLFLWSVFFWLISACTHRVAPLRSNKLLFGLMSLLFIPGGGCLVNHIVRSAVRNTSSAWWPDFAGEFGWFSIILPLSCLLFTAGSVRLVIWSLSHFIQSVRSPTETRLHRIPGWICLAAAILIMTPLLIDESMDTTRRNATDRIAGWIHERETLLPLAIQSNLEALIESEDIRSSLATQDPGSRFSAFQAWANCDLKVLDLDFGIEIRNAEGIPVDRFSPGFRMLSLPPDRILHATASQTKPLFLPRLSQSDTHWYPKTAVGPVMGPDAPIGYVILQVPTGPESLRPQPGQWGHPMHLFSSFAGPSPDWPENAPIHPDPDWFAIPPGVIHWYSANTGKHDVLVVKPPIRDLLRPEIVIGILPVHPLSAHLAGIARMIVLAILVLLPGTLYREIRRLATRKKADTYGSFTRQLLGAFLLPVILLPVILAVMLHRIIDETLINQQKATMQHTLGTRIGDLHQQLSSQAMRHQAAVESYVNASTESSTQSVSGTSTLSASSTISSIPGTRTLPTDIPWVILDGHGRITHVSTEPLAHSLPLASISRVFQDRHFRDQGTDMIHFHSIEPGLLSAQAVLPYPLSDRSELPAEGRGTFICEIPITGELVQQIAEPDSMALDIYAQGSIAASNRPELFNIGAINDQIDGTAFRTLVLDQSHDLVLHDLVLNHYAIYGGLDDENGDTVAALRLVPRTQAAGTIPDQPKDWLLIATVLLLIIGICVSTIFGHRLARPIQALTWGAREIARGNLSTIIPESGMGETRILTRTFNAMAHDLDHQRRELEERHEFISTLLARMSSVIIAADDAGRILSINRAFEALFTCPVPDCNRVMITELFDTLGLPDVRERVESFRSGVGEDRLLTRFLHQGRTIHLSVVLVELAASDGRKGMLIVIEDITGTVHSSKLQAYTDLARRIAHEVKNPLTPIQLSIEHLRQAWEDGAENFDSIFSQCLTMIQDEVQSLERIASEFSRFARFPKPEFLIADIRDVVREVALMYLAPPDSIRLEVQMDDQPVFCRFDRDQMKRVLINMCQNAVQAMPDGGQLLIRVVSDESRSEGVIVIEDTGVGMDETTLMHLFEPYFSTRKEGTGLGLVITKAVMDAHDGDIQVSSRLGEGTRFTLTLPRVEKMDETERDSV